MSHPPTTCIPFLENNKYMYEFLSISLKIYKGKWNEIPLLCELCVLSVRPNITEEEICDCLRRNFHRFVSFFTFFSFISLFFHFQPGCRIFICSRLVKKERQHSHNREQLVTIHKIAIYKFLSFFLSLLKYYKYEIHKFLPSCTRFRFHIMKIFFFTHTPPTNTFLAILVAINMLCEICMKGRKANLMDDQETTIDFFIDRKMDKELHMLLLETYCNIFIHIDATHHVGK